MKSSLKTFQIILEYDGSIYHGWQCQKEVRTIQGTIEKALRIMVGHRVKLIGSGRTDAGVHAFGQVASFQLETHLTSGSFFKGLNSLTPEDIVVKACRSVHNNFHARFDVKFKTYQYYIINDYLPPAIGRRFVWHIRPKLDMKLLSMATTYFLGSKDFKTFEASGSPRVNTVRTVTKSFIKQNDKFIIYVIEGSGFLRFMVRNIVGTLVDVGLGKIQVEEIPKLIASKNRSKIGITAPSHGLFLVRVDY